MRGGYNVQCRDGEWWARKGNKLIAARAGDLSWWWTFDVNAQLSIVANPYWALAYDRTLGFSALYTPAATENVTFTNGSATVTTTSLRVVGQLMVASISAGSGYGSEVYEIVAASGAGPFSATLDRAYEGTSGTKQRSFIDPLARNLAGTATTTSEVSRVGSCVVFEQLVTYAATAVHAASPATTSGHSYLIITSNRGTPVAIDLTAFLSGTRVGALRTWFYNTALSTPAQVGANSALNLTLAPRGIYAEVYENRLFIGYATDANGSYGDRTVWYSQFGDFLKWHTGLAGLTAAPNTITFDGEGDEIAELKTLGDDLVAHRWFSRETMTGTQSLQQPFVRRSHKTRIGIHDRFAMTNRCIVADGRHWIWTRNGPAVWDGANLRLVARDAYASLLATEQLDGQGDIICVLHDERNRLIVWMTGATNTNRHQDALPANSSTYGTVLVYKYDTDEAWLEDHPIFRGGGMMSESDGGSVVPQLHVSRDDGSIFMLYGRTTAKDADVTDPTNGTAVTVNAQVETGWLDFGALERKQLTRVLLVLRSLATGPNWDKTTDLSAGTYGLRMQVFTDWDESTARSDFWQSYSSASSQLTNKGEDRQAPTFSLLFSPNVHGMVFKLRFSNALTATATSAGHVQAPFRISEIQAFYDQQQSIDPRTTLSGTSYSE
jgi:hypothetical protein